MAAAPIAPMMATLDTSLPIGPEWTYEVKWDGYRAMLVSDGSRVRVISRNLKDLTSDYPAVAAAAAGVSRKPFVIDGEIVALDRHGLPSFQALQHRSVERRMIAFYAFDLLRLGSADYRGKPLAERRRALHTLTFAPPILLSTPLPGTPVEIERAIRKAGLEGVVAKRKVRAGFTPGTRDDVWRRIAESDIADCPFANLPNSTGKSHWGEGITAEDMKALRWVTPVVVVQVAFTEWTAGGNLRHASFAGVREDKRARSVRRTA